MNELMSLKRYTRLASHDHRIELTNRLGARGPENKKQQQLLLRN